MPKTWCEILIVLVICAILVALLIPNVQQSGGGSYRRELCRNNLHEIALALHNYHDDHGSFPPAFIADAEGRPMHSWRVLILPYLDQQERYERYDFTQPWDGPDNAKLAQELPVLEVYRCPSDTLTEGVSPHSTSYLAVVGPHTCWPGTEPVSLAEITDSTAETLLVVESSNSSVHWMEPRDLHISQMAPVVSPQAGQGIQSPHTGGAFAMRVDGAVRFVSENLDPQTLRRLIERDDGEEVGDF